MKLSTVFKFIYWKSRCVGGKLQTDESWEMSVLCVHGQMWHSQEEKVSEESW